MLWTEMTSDAFERAVMETGGLCVVPMGCLERHGPHLPLGTDQIGADAVARRAAEQEPAVVFPSYYFGQIAEARHCPGTLALPHGLLLKLLMATLDEIGRNGFGKVLIANGHGGSRGLLDYLTMAMLQEPRDYVLYCCFLGQLEEEDADRWLAMRETTEGGHAGEAETSVIMHLRPELVHMEDLGDPDDGRARGRQKHLRGTTNPFWWYADYPTQLAGDPRPASAEKGEFLVGAAVRRLVGVMRAVKADQTTPELQREFFGKAGRAGMDG
ncbi:MAG: creatininase family protein [Planctomycetota bacterium]|jgi:creatinine amidohydrolase